MGCVEDAFRGALLCLYACVFHFVIVLCLASSTRGFHTAQAHGTVDISPVEPTFLVGTNITLSCMLAETSTVSAQDIKWSRDGVTLPSALYSVVGDKTSLLRIQNAQFEDSGLYACTAEKSSSDEGNKTEVFVGVPPNKAVDLSCYCRNYYDVTCKWSGSSETNLNTTYTLQYFSIHETLPWQNCTGDICSCDNDQMCTVKNTIHGPVNFRVMSSNSLGDAISEAIMFNFETETVPFPPGRIFAKAISRSRLNVTWDLPSQWRSHYAHELNYKVEYYKRGSTVLMEYSNTDPESVSRLYAKLPSPDRLDAYTWYCVKVAARVGKNMWSDWSDTICNRTLEDVPDAEVNATWRSEVNAKNDSQRDVFIQWEPLAKIHKRGVILGYHVNITNIREGYVRASTLGPKETSWKFLGLERYKGYTFVIQAFNSAGASPKSFLDITAEAVSPQASHSVVVVISCVLGSVFLLGLYVLGWYCIKYCRLLKPVPNISFIELDRFERVVSRPVHRRVAEREVFDELVGHRTPNGVIPGKSHPSHVGGAAAFPADGEADYVQLREQARSEEGLPLLRSNSEAGSCSDANNSSRKLSQASTDSANNSEVSTDRELYSPDSTDTSCKKFDKLYVQLPDPALQGPDPAGLGQPRLDSTDSGFGENCADYRTLSYTRLSSLPSPPGEEAESSPSGDHDSYSDDSSSDVYHRLANGDPVGTTTPSNSSAYTASRVPSYTRLSSMPNSLFSGMATPGADQEVIPDSNGHLSNGTLPSIGRHETGST